MRFRYLLLTTLACSCLTVSAQNKPSQTDYLEVPREQVLVAVVSQPRRCPLVIEAATLLLRINDGKTEIRYRIRNISDKPIASFTVVSWSTRGGGGSLPVIAPPNLLRPGGELDSIGAGQILPLTEERLEQLKKTHYPLFAGKMLEVKILMVDQVSFADGTIYRDQKTSEAIKDYLADNLHPAVEP